VSDAVLDPTAAPGSAAPGSAAPGSAASGSGPDDPHDLSALVAHPTTELDADAGLFSPGRRSLTLGLVMTITLVAFESLAIGAVMPVVAKDLGDFSLYGWVFSAFFLASLIGIVVAGGWIDRGGMVGPLATGLGLFTVGLLIGGLAPSMEVLILARFLQGLGAGAIPPVGYVSIGRALPDQLRPRMFAVLSTAWVLPGVIGPALAGAIAQVSSWRLVFLGLLPLIGVAAAITLPAIRRAVPSAAEAAATADADGRVAERASAFRRRLPLALLLTLGAGLLVAGLTDGQPIPGGPLIVVGLGLVIPAFRALTPAGTLRAERGLPAAVLLRGVLTFTFFCADAYVPLALQAGRGLSPAVAGIALTGATLSWTAGAWVQARQIGRLGATRLVRSGFLVVVVGVASFAIVLSPAVPVVLGLLAWTVAGFGMGLAYAPISLTVLRDAPPGGEGAATSGLQLSDVLGTALGTGVGGALIALGVRSGADPRAGLLACFAVGALVGLGGFSLAGRLRRPGEPDVPTERATS
jgi:MFS family permease